MACLSGISLAVQLTGLTVEEAMGRVRTILGWLVCGLSCLFLTSCGSGGGDGGGGGSPPAAQALTVSGAVQAPGGQVVFNPSQGLLQQFAQFIAPTAYASISGLTPLPDGIPVQLIRLNAVGTSFSILSTTMTSGGRYSFNLTNLDLEPSNDLALRVANGSVQMRAFVTGMNVDIDPASEVAVQLVLEKIMATPGSTINHYTVQELADITGSINILAATKELAAGLNIATTVTSISNAVTSEPELMAFANAAADEGQTTEGPGDIGNYYPYGQGRVSHYQGTVAHGGLPTGDFSSFDKITGTKVIGGVSTTVLLETNRNNVGRAEEHYLAKDNRGVTFYGNNNTSDFLTPQLAPIRTVRFPLVAGDVVEVVNKKGLNSGFDLDGDGKLETVDLKTEYRVLAFETVVVPAGTFPNSVKIETRQIQTYHSSAFGISASIKAINTFWRAPGIGYAKKIELIQSQGFVDDFNETIAEELVELSTSNQISLATNDIIYDPKTKLIYASTPGSPGTITPIDPLTGTIGTAIPVGNEPTKLALSYDGQYLYVGFEGEGAVQRVDLITQTAGLKFSLGSDPFFGPYYVEDLEVLPGSPQSIAISRKYKGVSPKHAGVVIFDNGVHRSTITPVHTGSNVIEFSQTASTLYGYNNESTEFGFRRMAVDASGVTVTDVFTSFMGDLINGTVDIKFHAGFIYTTSGRKIDPQTRTIAGIYSLPTGLNLSVRPDSTLGRVFFLVTQFSGVTQLFAFNENSLQLIGSFDVEGITGNELNLTSSLIRWGAKGLAFRTSHNQVFLIQSDKLIP